MSYLGIIVALAVAAQVQTAGSEDSVDRRPTKFFCVHENQINIVCSFLAWPGTQWNLSYFTDLPSNALSNSIRFTCHTGQCAVTLPEYGQLFATYSFKLQNLTQPSLSQHAEFTYQVYSDNSITRLKPPEDIMITTSKTSVNVTWSAPLKSFGVLEYILRDLAQQPGIDHEVICHPAGLQDRAPQVLTLYSTGLVNLTVSLTDLQPFTNYTILVRNRLHGSTAEEAWSPQTAAVATTLEDAPAVAPEMVDNGFHVSRSECNDLSCVVTIYWKGIPEAPGYSNGKITSYLIRSSSGQEATVSRDSRQAKMTLSAHGQPQKVAVLGSTREGQGPLSPALVIPPQHEIYHLDPCMLSVKELNQSTVSVSWKLSTLSETQTGKLHTIYWCHVMFWECQDVHYRHVDVISAGSIIIALSDGPASQYRFGMAVIAQGSTSGIVWHDCPADNFGTENAQVVYGNIQALTLAEVAGLVVAVAAVCSALAVTIWWFFRDGKSVQHIKHIPRTSSTDMVKGSLCKYEAVSPFVRAHSEDYAKCVWKGSLSQSTADCKDGGGDYQSHSALGSSLHLIQEVSSSPTADVQSAAVCQTDEMAMLRLCSEAEHECNSETTPQGQSDNCGYQVSFEQLLSQQALERSGATAKDAAANANICPATEQTADEITPVHSGSSLRSISSLLASLEALRGNDHSAVDEIEKFSASIRSHPSSDYVMVDSIGPQT